MNLHIRPKCAASFLAGCREEKSGYHCFRVKGLFGIDESNLINHTTWTILNLCDGEHDLSQIICVLRDKYPEAYAVIEDDVCKTILAMQQMGVVECEAKTYWKPTTPFVKRIKEGVVALCDCESEGALRRFFAGNVTVIDFWGSVDGNVDPIFNMCNAISQELTVALVLDTGEIAAVAVFGVLLGKGEEEIRLMRVVHGVLLTNAATLIFHSLAIVKECLLGHLDVTNVRATARTRREKEILESAGFASECDMNDFCVAFFIFDLLT